MGTVFKTGCVMCAQNCGLAVEVENNRIVRVLSDRDNARSEGYICRKGMNIAFHQHHAQRLRVPLKREGSSFTEISWEQAVDEIGVRLGDILKTHGPRSFVYMGGGGQGCHFEAAFGVRLLRGLGSQYHYNALGQELTGHFWVNGRAFGRQYFHLVPDIERTDMMLAVGWNGLQSHQMPQARRFLNRIAKDPEKLLVVVDPRVSETARIADIHLPVRPGTDALLYRAMIAIILQEGWENRDYIEKHTSGFEMVRSWFEGFDARAAVRVCELDYEKVREVCRLFATRRSCLRSDLGILMNRHSTAASCLEVILQAICGRIGVPGGMVIPGHLMPIGAHSNERNPKAWRTVATDFPAIMGVYPPNVLPEEILTEGPDRVRAVLVSGSNPLRSYADTSAYEKAFGKLDLLVTLELAMTETAVLSHYVLPARSAYESWDSTFFPWTWPGIFFQMRRPVVEPEGEPLELSDILLRLADRMGLVPKIPESLVQAAVAGRKEFGRALFAYLQEKPEAMRAMPFVLGMTLGKALGSVNLAALWGLLQAAPQEFRECAARAGFEAGPKQAEQIFEAILAHPEGVWIGKTDPERNLESLRTQDGKIQLHIPELADWVREIRPEREEADLQGSGEWPLVLMAGRHYDNNANTLMRDPAWNKGRRDCTLLMHPDDAAGLGLRDGQRVRVVTEAGKVEVELEVAETARKGHVVMPHGFGLVFAGVEHGANVNRLTRNTHRDRFAATPLHRYVPCRVEAA
jgi:anaerobic selenocysteine-containing dehydrogenase